MCIWSGCGLGSGMVPTSGGGGLGLPPIMRGGKYKVLGGGTG